MDYLMSVGIAGFFFATTSHVLWFLVVRVINSCVDTQTDMIRWNFKQDWIKTNRREDLSIFKYVTAASHIGWMIIVFQWMNVTLSILVYTVFVFYQPLWWLRGGWCGTRVLIHGRCCCVHHWCPSSRSRGVGQGVNRKIPIFLCVLYFSNKSQAFQWPPDLYLIQSNP